jgi:hypothetical protein
MNKIHVITCLLAVLLFGSTSFAQDVKFGLRAGLSLPNITAGGTKTPISEGYSSRLASGMGIFTELDLKKRWSIRWGVEYSGQGGKKDGMQAMPTMRVFTEMASAMGMGGDPNTLQLLQQAAGLLPDCYYADVDNKVKFNYVMIPILAQYTFDLGQSSWSLYINAGPFVSFLISGKQDSKGSSKLFADAGGREALWDKLGADVQQAVAVAMPALETTLREPVSFGKTNITDELKSANFGVTGNVGIRYRYKRNYFFLEGGGNYGFIKVQQDSKNGSNRLGAATVMLGYAFSFQ